MNGAGAAVRVQGLRKAFRGRPAVDGLSLTVERGEIFGLVGPDGAGKTTTMRLMCGILTPDAGSMSVASYDVAAEPEDVKRRIGYLSQTFSQYPDMTMWENLAFTASLYEVPDGEWQEQANRLLEASRMQPFHNRLAGRLSGGMKQKLALSCTLLHTPEVVFLDEPTTGVDPVSRREFWSILYDLPRSGVTIVISTPFMDEAERCGRLAFIQEGRVLASGTPQELKSRVGEHILALETDRPRDARNLLAGRDDVSEAILFGDRLHIVPVAGVSAEATLREALETAGIQVERMEPTVPGLEDAFVHIAREAGQGAAQ